MDKFNKNNLPGARWILSTNRNVTHSGNSGVFDELIVYDWLHIEQMDDDCWWMRIGDADIRVFIEDNGHVVVVVERGIHAEVNRHIIKKLTNKKKPRHPKND